MLPLFIISCLLRLPICAAMFSEPPPLPLRAMPHVADISPYADAAALLLPYAMLEMLIRHACRYFCHYDADAER